VIGHHLTGTDGAVTVATADHKRLGVLVAQAHAFRGAFAVTSDVAGVGKSVSARQCAEATGAAVHTLTLIPGTSAAVANATLLDALGVRVGPSAPVHETTYDLRELLSDRPRIVIVENAHDLGGELLAHLRVLHQTSEFTLGMVGHARLYERASAQPELFESVDRWVRFEPIPTNKMVKHLTEYHSLFSTCDPSELDTIDTQYAKGRWRRWASFLRTARMYDKGSGLTPKVINNTLVALDWKRLVVQSQ
jgi:type II secretory pathway predicted ATPase ExeA